MKTRSDKLPVISCIYQIHSPIGKVYIGQTRDFYRRLREYKRLDCKGQIKLYNSFKKYGFEAHKISILCECPIEQLNQYESHLIAYLCSFNTTNGLNLTSGGNGKRISEETKKKISEGRLGAKHWNYGKKASEETRRKLSDAHKRYVATPETRRKISLANKGKKLSEATRLALSKYNKGRTGALCHNSKRITQYDLSGNIVKEWSSAADVKRLLGLNQNNITSNCRGERRIVGGFVWRFENEPFELRSRGAKKCKPVQQFNLDGEFIKEYNSAQDAYKELKLAPGTLYSVLHGKTKQAFGFKWKYKN